MQRKTLTVFKHGHDLTDITDIDVWKQIKPQIIEHYLWMQNDYTPHVSVKLFHSTNFIYLFFKTYEKKITVKHKVFGSDVYKDSCVEFFFNPFPQTSDEYFNIEINALGIALIGVGKKKGVNTKRYRFTHQEAESIEIISSIQDAIIGDHGKEHWTIHCKIPKSFIEAHYKQKLTNQKGIANFYKCGDETEFAHYGAWNNILSDEPNFHLPEYFGEIVFSEECLSTL